MPDTRVTTKPPQNLTRRTASGMLWAILSLICNKFASFIAQLYLGYVLSDGDFGLWATAAATQIFVGCFATGGTRKVLMARPAEYNDLARPSFLISFWFNFVAATVLAVGAPIWFHFVRPGELSDSERQTINVIVWVIAAALVVQSFGSSQRVKLGIDLRYKDFAVMSTVSAGLRHSSAIVLAFAGFGPLSLAFPVLVQAVVEAVMCCWMVGTLPRGKPLTWSLFLDLMASAKWAIFATLGVTLVMQGNYFAISSVESLAVVGLYYWGYQLTVSAMQPFTGMLAGVLTPSFVRLNQDQKRQGAAFTRVVRTVVLAAAPVAVFSTLTWPLLIHVMWRGKWDAAIVVTQILALSTGLRTLQPMAVALLEARGQFKATAFLMLIDGITTVIAALLGAWLGGLLEITAAVGVHRAVISVIECLWVAKQLGVGRRKLLLQILPPLLLTAAVGGLAWIPVRVFAPPARLYEWMALSGVAMILVYTLAARLIMPVRFGEVIDLMPGKLRRFVPAFLRVGTSERKQTRA